MATVDRRIHDHGRRAEDNAPVFLVIAIAYAIGALFGYMVRAWMG